MGDEPHQGDYGGQRFLKVSIRTLGYAQRGKVVLKFHLVMCKSVSGGFEGIKGSRRAAEACHHVAGLEPRIIYPRSQVLGALGL